MNFKLTGSDRKYERQFEDNVTETIVKAGTNTSEPRRKTQIVDCKYACAYNLLFNVCSRLNRPRIRRLVDAARCRSVDQWMSPQAHDNI